MNDSKLERQLNLFFLLLNSNKPIQRGEIKEKISDYKKNDSDQAFERMFERDKDDLRKNGIKISTVQTNPLFEDEIGYLLDKETFIEKDLVLNDEEKLVLSYSLNLLDQNDDSDEINRIYQKIGIINSDFADTRLVKFNKDVYKIFRNILDSILNNLDLKIYYFSSHDDMPRWRTVQTYSIKKKRNDIFIECQDPEDSKFKTFRLNNILDSELTDKKFNRITFTGKENDEYRKSKIEIIHNLKYYANLLNGKIIDDNHIEIDIYNYKAAARFLLPYLHIVVNIKDKDLKKAVVDELEAIKGSLNG